MTHGFSVLKKMGLDEYFVVMEIFMFLSMIIEELVQLMGNLNMILIHINK